MNKTEEIEALLDKLDDEERLEIIDKYCESCGTKDPACQCGNDE